MIYIGDFVEWRDQRQYPGLRGIVTKIIPSQEPPRIFVHWEDPDIGPCWEEEYTLRIISAITKDIK
jgi:hypothetical protein